MAPPTKLSEKHWKALEMLDQDASRQDVADALGFKKQYLDYLCVGNVEKTGKVATLFKGEYDKIQVKSKKECDDLIRENLRTAQRLMKRVFADIELKKTTSPEDKKILSLYTNAIAKCQPAVSIKNLSYSYTKGLLPEELIHEFKRLKTIAESSFDRGAIQQAPEGRAGDVPEVDE